MIDQTVRRLDQLVQTDPAVAPLARLQAVALRAAADPAWAAGVPTLTHNGRNDGCPLLHGQILTVAPTRCRRLLDDLVAAASVTWSETGAEVTRLGGALQAGLVDPLALLRASIAQDGEALGALAAAAGVDADLLATFGHLAAVPLLLACGQAAAPLLDGWGWAAGYCPVCAGWPVLAELRGLERRRWLRCGRCGAGWASSSTRCPFCTTDNHQLLGYLAPAEEREARQVSTCDACRGFLKTFTTLGPLPPAEIGLRDLTSLELDIAALEREYSRPGEAGFPLDLQIEAPSWRRGWIGWRR